MPERRGRTPLTLPPPGHHRRPLELIPNLGGANQRHTPGQREAMLWFRTGSDSVNDAAFRMLDAQSAA